MQISVPAETWQNERRVALIPDSVQRLTKAGFDIALQSGAGAEAGYSDDDYEAAGATISNDRSSLLSSGDVVLRVRKPDLEEVSQLKEGALHISYLDPYNESDLVDALSSKGITAISMEMIPRTTRAQKMDALSSQANLAGYVMVIQAAQQLDRILPMMMTPAGTLSPAKVFVIGAGVAGLQAIATAKRLGARVEAFDTRPVVAEQVQSLGGKFVEIDLGETGQTKDGYAKELTAEQLEMQREGMKAVISESDIVITTAQVFGRPAPRIVTADMVEAMKPGGVIVDMAVDSGGNVEGSVADETAEIGGVKILGLSNLPAQVSKDASQMYSSNLFNLVSEYWDSETKAMNLDLEDDILQSCVITHGGSIVNETIKNLRGS
jgi:NAD(P) transhydrogenase subunit alpha